MDMAEGQSNDGSVTYTLCLYEQLPSCDKGQSRQPLVYAAINHTYQCYSWEGQSNFHQIQPTNRNVYKPPININDMQYSRELQGN